ncbi:S-adenosyl-L-methionine-dependent methyltransferase [Rickenella mellea]|uniref:S-adenosyl-L-methionine-dependent methyltransferase n=1 Tax=Rickenella mellea TaxID=50990 RepID=A0A4Y7PQD8_9AGAM|nr:S-adenosyl-L-methionine-dependent methyltransferase [Rickenella mellea]
MTIAPGSRYILPTDENERHRLERQHAYLRTEVYNDRLIFDINVHIPDDGYVLDAGTGSGAWIMDLAPELPKSVHLYGVDTSTKLFPRDPPVNLNVSKGSVTKLLPNWTGRFDFVHQRLLMVGLLKTEWPVAIAEIFRVLKPGGHVQFLELINDQPAAETPATKKHEALRIALYEKQGLMYDCAAQLPRMLREAGFVNVAERERPAYVGKDAGPYGMLGKQVLEGAFRGMKTPVMKAGGLGIISSEHEFDELIDELDNEWEKAGCTRYAFNLVCAQKPY